MPNIVGALGISCGPLLGNDCSCSWGQLQGWRGAVAIPGVESPCFPSLQGRELGTMIISGESCFCPILILYQITFLSVPCPVSLATLRAYCVLDNGNTAMNNTKSPFSWSFLFGISRNHSLGGGFPVFPNTALISDQGSLRVKDPESPFSQIRPQPDWWGEFSYNVTSSRGASERRLSHCFG